MAGTELQSLTEKLETEINTLKKEKDKADAELKSQTEKFENEINTLKEEKNIAITELKSISEKFEMTVNTLNANQLVSSKYFTQEEALEACETISKMLYDPD